MKKNKIFFLAISFLFTSCFVTKNGMSQEETIDTYSILEKEYETKIKELEESVTNLEEIIASLEEDKKNLSNELENKHFIEDFSFPLPEKYRSIVSSKQGFRESMKVNIGGSTLATYHNGLDIPVPYGTPVFAAKDGYIEECYPGALNGKTGYYKGQEVFGACILIQHFDDFQSLYGHLSKTIVREGDYIERGQLIGYSGGTGQASGKSTGNHLHFSIFPNIDRMIR